MKLTTRGRYAVAAILDIALHQEQGPIRVEQLAKRQSLSKAYLERLAGLLRSNGLLRSIRGPGGGYLLAKKPVDITLAHVIEAVDEPMDTTQCQGKEDCQGGHKCLTHHIWVELNLEILQYLNGITLDSLMKRQAIRSISSRQTRLNTETI